MEEVVVFMAFKGRASIVADRPATNVQFLRNTCSQPPYGGRVHRRSRSQGVAIE